MGIVALLVVLAAFPAFLGLLGSTGGRRWAFFALGALPILQTPLNLDANFISWSTWPGYSKGLMLTLLDSLALAICLRYARRGGRMPPMMWAFAIYFASMLPGVFVGYFTPALFVVFQLLRVTLFFYAAYLVVANGQLMRVAEGLAVAVIVSGLFSAYEAFSGALQAAGLFGHQNLTGLINNLCVPLLLALGLRTKRLLFLLAVAAALVGAVAGGSRATMAMFAFVVGATLVTAVIVKPTGRKIALAGLAAVGVVAAIPFALQKFEERNITDFQVDGEREAFERAAAMMADDHPFGVGINQFVNEANVSGYYARAGVRWGVGARSTNVHHAYWLVRAEAGLIGLAGLLVWLFVPIVVGMAALFRKRLPLREASVACGVAVMGVAFHSQYEWALVTATPQYLISLMAGVIAALAAYPVSAGKRRPALPADPTERHREPQTSGARTKPAGL